MSVFYYQKERKRLCFAIHFILMDRPIAPKKKLPVKWLLAISTVFLLLFFFYAYLSNPAMDVDSSSVTIRQTSLEDFQELIALDGIVLPVRTVIIDALIGGKVVEKYVADGDMLTSGSPILKLENTDLQLDILNKETAVFDLLNNIQNTRNLLDQTLVNRRDQLTDAHYNLTEAEREFKLNEILYEKDGISRQALIRSENTYQYYLTKKKLIEQALVQDSLSAENQIKQMRSSVIRARENLQLMQQKLNDLVIRSPIAGQLSSFDPETGQLVAKGDNIGQIDVLSSYKVRIRIDERYVNRITEGSAGRMEYEGKTYRLHIRHVYPTILNNEFTADMVFREQAPAKLKRGQQIVVRLELSDVKKAIVLPKGGFFQSSGGNAVFVVNEDGSRAVKRAIRIGRQNPEYYEILEGLEAGESVITSSYEQFMDQEIIYLK